MDNGKHRHTVLGERHRIENRRQENRSEASAISDFIKKAGRHRLRQFRARPALVFRRIDAVWFEVNAIHPFVTKERSYPTQTRPEVDNALTVQISKLAPIVYRVRLRVKEGTATVRPEPISLRDGSPA